LSGHFFMYNTVIGKDIDAAKGFLEQGELVAIPTETVYGLAANGLNELAIIKIYTAKNRPQFNPLILHVANMNQLETLVREIPLACRKLIQSFSPGPITYLLPKSRLVPDIVTAGSDLVAIRIPDHPLTLSLLSRLNFPLAAPSANPSGYVSPVSAAHVMQGLNNKIPYILDGGACRVGLESTIIGFAENKVIVHRLGGIGIEQIKNITGLDVEFALSHASPMAPGQLKSHYATRTPFLLGDVELLANDYQDKKIGIISFRRSYENIHPYTAVILSPSGDLNEAASKLFSTMRELDNSGLDFIIAERFPEEGMGLAINDRLERAAYQ